MTTWRTEPEDFEIGTDGSGVIVTGIDGTRSAMRALAYAAGLARRSNGRVMAVHVRAPGAASIAWGAGFGVDVTGAGVQAVITARQAIEAELRAETEHLAGTWNVRIDFVVREGDRLKELTAVARDEHADAVV